MHYSYLANEIVNRLDTAQVFEYYGIHPNAKGFVCCPFHNEKTPSFKIYDGTRGFHCFGCGAHGNVIDFVKKFFNLNFYEAINKINDDFSLGLPIGKKIDKRTRLEVARKAFEANKEREREKEKRKKAKEAYYKALDNWIRLDKQRQQYKPKNSGEELHPLFVEAIKNIDKAAYELEAAQTELFLDDTRNS